jgi:hypothetical protein
MSGWDDERDKQDGSCVDEELICLVPNRPQSVASHFSTSAQVGQRTSNQPFISSPGFTLEAGIAECREHGVAFANVSPLHWHHGSPFLGDYAHHASVLLRSKVLPDLRSS